MVRLRARQYRAANQGTLGTIVNPQRGQFMSDRPVLGADGCSCISLGVEL